MDGKPKNSRSQNPNWQNGQEWNLKKKLKKIQNKTNSIKKIRTKFDIKTKWNKMLRDKIEKQNQFKKRIKNKTNRNQKNYDQIWYYNKIIWHFLTFPGQHNFRGKETEMREKKKQKAIRASSLHCCAHATHHQKGLVVAIQMHPRMVVVSHRKRLYMP